MPYTPILATLGYVLSPDGRRVLLVHRNRRPGDAHFGKYNGLGGKLEPDEDVVACLRREIREESGLECDGPACCAARSAGPASARTARTGSASSSASTASPAAPGPRTPRGRCEWVEVERVLGLPLWEGDRHFLPLVFDHATAPVPRRHALPRRPAGGLDV